MIYSFTHISIIAYFAHFAKGQNTEIYMDFTVFLVSMDENERKRFPD
jgi:hypothetical protein